MSNPEGSVRAVASSIVVIPSTVAGFFSFEPLQRLAEVEGDEGIVGIAAGEVAKRSEGVVAPPVEQLVVYRWLAVALLDVMLAETLKAFFDQYEVKYVSHAELHVASDVCGGSTDVLDG